MDEIIYVLGAVAYIAYTIYSATQKQKKKQQNAQNQAQPYSPPETEEAIKKDPGASIFEEILGVNENDFNLEEELFGKKPEPKPEPEPVFVENKKEATKLDSIPKEEGVSALKRKKDKKKNNDFVFEKEHEEGIDYEFDLRDAIISSEILNPPYIER